MDNDSPLSMVKEAEAAFLQAAHKVVQRAKMFNTPIVIWEDGQIKKVPAHVMEERLKVISLEEKQEG
ncbi:hypothetical protein [Desulfonatronospira sp.]|uniref:hypothetical protein n=1 Tax=Desulfonatronospira sp. TaxID=1962951 RepID=UPI0025B8BA0F|nr:hypothetical protein [Desulfonatronospira sp.]